MTIQTLTAETNQMISEIRHAAAAGKDVTEAMAAFHKKQSLLQKILIAEYQKSPKASKRDKHA